MKKNFTVINHNHNHNNQPEVYLWNKMLSDEQEALLSKIWLDRKMIKKISIEYENLP